MSELFDDGSIARVPSHPEVMGDIEAIMPVSARSLDDIEREVGWIVNDFSLVGGSHNNNAVSLDAPKDSDYYRIDLSIFRGPNNPDDKSEYKYADITLTEMVTDEHGKHVGDLFKTYELLANPGTGARRLEVTHQMLSRVPTDTRGAIVSGPGAVEAIRRSAELQDKARAEEEALGLTEATEKDAKELLDLLRRRGGEIS